MINQGVNRRDKSILKFKQSEVMANVNFKKWLCPVIKVLDFVLHVVFRVPCPKDHQGDGKD